MANSVFNKMIEGSEEQYHVIVCNHPFYRALGLSTMTTGTLFDFLHTTNGKIADSLDEVKVATTDNPDGLFPNRAAFVAPDNGAYISVELAHILGTYSEEQGPTPYENYKWMGWRPNNEGTGRYENSSLADWEIFDKDFGGTVDQDSLRIFEPDDLWPEIGILGRHAIGFGYNRNVDAFRTLGADHKKQCKGVDITDADLTFSTVLVENPILPIIDMNTAYAGMRSYYPRSVWKDEFSSEAQNVFAEADFLTDVKASKSGCIQWSGAVTFNISYGGGLIECQQTELVNFSLYLFDRAYKRPQGNGAALRKVNIVDHKRDVANGRLYGKNEDGDFESIDPNDDKTKTAGELELSYNPVLKKWESGTPNLIGMLKTPLNSAKNIPGLENVINADVGLDLDGDPDNHFVPSTGLVIPIRPQNGNKHQFMPNYAQDKECRKSSSEPEKKEEFLVYNYNPLKRYDAGTMVMLTRVDGVWMASDLGSGISISQEQEVDANVGKWSFNYFMTNYEYHFRQRGVNASTYTPRQAEQDFHIKYYHDSVAENEINFKKSFTGFDTTQAEILNVHDEYFQITSFDQLDNQLYGIRSKTSSELYPSTGNIIYERPGTRPISIGGMGTPADKNAIATTQATVDAAGRAIPFGLQEYTDRNAAHSASFFGCVFPNGYRDEEKLAIAASIPSNTGFYKPAVVKGWESAPTGGFPFLNGGYKTSYSPGEAINAGIYFNDGEFFRTKGAETTNPFEEGIKYIKRDENNQITQEYEVDRSDVRAATRTPYDEQLTQEGNVWQQFNPDPAPSLLHEYNLGVGNRFSFAQMPADVFLNASPSGKNGQPQRNIHRCAWMNSNENSIYQNDGNRGFRDLVKKTILDGDWLAIKDADTVTTPNKKYDIMDSLFDISPRSRGTLEYRPLKLELYCSVLQLRKPSQDKNLYRRYKDQVNTQASAQMFSYTSPISRAAGDRNIESSYSKDVAAGAGLPDEDITRKADAGNQPQNAVSQGLLINDFVYVAGGQASRFGRESYNGLGLRMAHDLTTPDYNTNRHQGGYWGPDAEGSVGNRIWGLLQEDPTNSNKSTDLEKIGAGACGVISTSCKVSTNENLVLTTTQRYGMNPWSVLESSRTNTNFWFGFSYNTSQGGGFKNYKSWGTSIPGDPYRQPNTIAMVARIYHGWPEEQTIFDARNLAVHHFNPDVQFENASNTDGANEGKYRDGRHFTEEKFEVNDGNNPPNQIKFFYAAPIPSSTVDLVVPSVFKNFPLNTHANDPDGDTLLLAEPCPVGATGYKDVVNGDFDGSAGQRELAPRNLWRIDDKRVGKLLPYKYKYVDFGLQEDDADGDNGDTIELKYTFGTNHPLFSLPYPVLKQAGGTAGNVTKWTNLNAIDSANGDFIYTEENPLIWADAPQTKGLLITSVGSGYRVGDTFGTQWGSTYRVDGIVWSADQTDEGYLYDGSQNPPATEPLGYPWKLRKITRSRGVDPNDCADYSTPLYNGQDVGVSLNKLDGGGTGFVANWPVAFAMEFDAEDKKPALLEHPTEGDIPKLSADLDPPHTDSPSDDGQGWVTGTNTTTYTFTDSTRSPDRTYDLFVMMQNDISFCWQGSNDNFLGNTYNFSECDEQFIRLSIGVD